MFIFLVFLRALKKQNPTKTYLNNNTLSYLQFIFDSLQKKSNEKKDILSLLLDISSRYSLNRNISDFGKFLNKEVQVEKAVYMSGIAIQQDNDDPDSSPSTSSESSSSTPSESDPTTTTESDPTTPSESTSSTTSESTSSTSSESSSSDVSSTNGSSALSILVLSFVLLVVVCCVVCYIYKKNKQDDGIEYTQAVLGDDAFEFSQLETI